MHPLGPAGVTTLRAVPASACLREEIDRNTGNPDGEGAWPSTGPPRGTGRAGRGGGEARSSDEAGPCSFRKGGWWSEGALVQG